jgi:poly(3-hydroxybutyrate) depolymerase
VIVQNILNFMLLLFSCLIISQLLLFVYSTGKAVTANLLKFDQTEFFTGTSTSLEKFGYVYVPTACAAKTTSCRLHVSFHGCSQDYGSIQDTWAVHAGYNDWAEANNIIVVYPYVASSAQLGNPNACWDWWGYAGANYALQSGVQMQFSKKLIDRVMGV